MGSGKKRKLDVAKMRMLRWMCGVTKLDRKGVKELEGQQQWEKYPRKRRKVRQGAKTIKKNTNSTQNKSQTHRAKQYEVTSFLSTDCELSTETCSKNVYSLGPRYM